MGGMLELFTVKLHRDRKDFSLFILQKLITDGRTVSFPGRRKKSGSHRFDDCLLHLVEPH